MDINFGEKVKNLREDSDLNQTEFGKAVNMTQRKVSYIETGKCEPSLDDIRKIAIFFNISADFLIGLKKNPLPLYKR